MWWTKEQLWELRQEVCLDSVCLDDFENSFGIDNEACCGFFDGYLDFLCEKRDSLYERGVFNKTPLMSEEFLSLYDNPENLDEYLGGFDENPLPALKRDMLEIKAEIEKELEAIKPLATLLSYAYQQGCYPKRNETASNPKFRMLEIFNLFYCLAFDDDGFCMETTLDEALRNIARGGFLSSWEAFAEGVPIEDITV